MATIGLDGTGFSRGANAVRRQVGSLAATVGAAFSVGAITAFAKKTIEFSGHVTDLSTRLGVSTDYLQEMQYVMKQNGGSVDDLTAAFEKMGAARIKALEGDQNAIDAFAKFGISQEDLRTQKPQQIMDTIAARFKEFGRSDVLVSAFRELGGRGAGALVPAFVEGIEEGRETARRSGAVISPEVIAQLDEAGDAFDRFVAILQGNVAPHLAGIIETIIDAGDNLAASASYLGGLFSTFDLGKIIKSNFSLEGIMGGGGIGEFARQLGGASIEAEKAFDESVAQADARKEEAAKKRAAKLALAQQQQEAPEKFDAKEPRVKTQTTPKVAAYSDSLVSVGNFLGSGRSQLETIAQKQLKLQEQANRYLDKIANPPPSKTLNVPPS